MLRQRSKQPPTSQKKSSTIWSPALLTLIYDTPIGLLPIKINCFQSVGDLSRAPNFCSKGYRNVWRFVNLESHLVVYVLVNKLQ